MGFSRNELMQSNLNFLKYPYLPVERTVHSLDPDNEIGKVVRLHKPIGDSGVTDEEDNLLLITLVIPHQYSHTILFIIYPTYSSIPI